MNIVTKYNKEDTVFYFYKDGFQEDKIKQVLSIAPTAKDNEMVVTYLLESGIVLQEDFLTKKPL